MKVEPERLCPALDNLVPEEKTTHNVTPLDADGAKKH